MYSKLCTRQTDALFQLGAVYRRSKFQGDAIRQRGGILCEPVAVSALLKKSIDYDERIQTASKAGRWLWILRGSVH
jgi:hypothetical protein